MPIAKAVGTFSSTAKAATVYTPQPTVTSSGSTMHTIRSIPLSEALEPYRTTSIQYAPQSIKNNSIGTNTIQAGNIAPTTITGAEIASLSISGKTITADTGTIGGWTLGSTELIGPSGAIIRSGQTDFSSGTGFWLGNVAGTPKFSIGQASGNKMEWDGTNLRITGAFTPTTVFNTISYTVANLPTSPTVDGPNSPSGNE